jgi:hypothetical protein
MRGAALLDLRGDHPDVVAERGRDLFEQQDPRRVNAVVIGDQNTGSGHLPLRIDAHNHRHARLFRLRAALRTAVVWL